MASLVAGCLAALAGYHWRSNALSRAHAEAGWTLFVARAAAFAWRARPPPA